MSALLQLFIFGTLRQGAPLMLASLGGLLSERSGVVNIGLEGMMLSGAFAGAVASYYTHNPYFGVIAAVLAGGFLGWIHALLTQTFKVDHIISGVALNLMALGITSYTIRRLPSGISDFSEVRSIAWPVIVAAAFVLLFCIYIWLNKTSWGVQVQAVGNSADKAKQMGIRPTVTRFGAVTASGMFAGLGGAFLSLSLTPGFSENMSSGRGFIALAALILGRWNPFGATFAAFAFGFFYQLEEYMQSAGYKLPTELLLSLPYLLTVIALAGFLGRSRPPADLGKV